MESPANNSLPYFVADMPMDTQLTARRLNAIISYVRSITPTRGKGTLVKRTSAGTTIDAVTASTATVIQVPFQLVDATAFEDSAYVTQVRIIFGTLQDTSSGGTSWIPTGMTEGDNPPYIIEVTGSGSVWLDVTFNTSTGNVTSVAIDFGETQPSNSSGHSYFSLGTYQVNEDENGVYVTGAKGDLACQMCGSALLYGGFSPE